ncbi:MAG: inositol monophosphatase family protein [Pseudomonadota bacterium]
MRQNDELRITAEADTDLAIRLCRKGGAAALAHFRRSDAQNKAEDGAYDPVTLGDQEAETAIRNMLESERPRDNILGEEFGLKDVASERCWTIDPIDGTRAFVSGVPSWGTLVGLREKGAFSIGAAYQPVTGDLFAGDGETAWLGSNTITTRKAVAIKDLRLSTTDVDLIDEVYRPAFAQLKAEVAITRLGLDWYAYGLLAAGHIDAVIECGLQVYDIAALVPIVRGAGGVVTDLKGGDDIGPTVIAASCPQVHDAVLTRFMA